ncbi:AAA family ATPase (plasmid) [Mycobacteroides abscessus]|uniref:AAA family ATPase n=1 Tax=Mycobacteroides abscessus TaxID=36809 RepID=UPI0009A7E1F5|nr:AAA family ATPase [Mycobacteroides abscessus]MBE5408239.1 type VII secretion AAA-ATPase EccA [Mycobacteroides abscessus]MBN7468730.1 AAA family ATPase [Mycobacteroides abscessus subsp. massiliense]OTR18071.1 hypothetical protein B9M82_02615 [Mycobacteroides abscessus]SLC56373.1 ATPase central domain-containing protein [Mycobacteroides abscessus subsp. massiliense]SLC81115.1 ATPase central domain-containing protein [Mycobacteroides abscessus subsp. massiliense]
MNEYRIVFDEGLRRWSAGDHAAALAAFRNVTDADPRVSDAWLGRIASGDLAVETFAAAHANSQLLTRETRRVNWPAGTLHATVEVPKYFLLKVDSRPTIALGYAAALITDRQYSAADAFLSADPTVFAGQERWHHFLRTCLFYATERWDGVLAAALAPVRAQPPATADEVVLARDAAAAVATMAAIGAARSGRYQHALDLLDGKMTGVSNPYLLADAALARGWSYRGLGDEEHALSAFQDAMIDGVQVAAARDAVNDPSLQLPVVTAEMLAARTDPWDVTTQPSAEVFSAAKKDEARKAAGVRWRKAVAQMVGHEDLKEQIEVWRNEIEIEIVMAEAEGRTLDLQEMTAGCIRLEGPPGTGKTDWARIIKDILFELGLIDEDKFIEVAEEDLVKGFVSQTAEATRLKLEEAEGGVMFLDEAYRLVPKTEGHSFGQSAIDTMVDYMDKHPRLVIIAAGYPADMKRFIAANAGLKDRFLTTFKFKGYTVDELVQIAGVFATKFKLVVADECWPVLRENVEIARKDPHFGNGRYVRKVMKHCRGERARRTHTLSRDELRELATNGGLGILPEDMARAVIRAGESDDEDDE